jgi:hypothetical protein
MGLPRLAIPGYWDPRTLAVLVRCDPPGISRVFMTEGTSQYRKLTRPKSSGRQAPQPTARSAANCWTLRVMKRQASCLAGTSEILRNLTGNRCSAEDFSLVPLGMRRRRRVSSTLRGPAKRRLSNFTALDLVGSLM